MQEHGYRVIPVNPRYESVLGEKCYKSLRDIPDRVDMVDVFRKTQDVTPIAEDAIAIGAKVLWQQLGVRNEAAAARGARGRPRGGSRPLRQDRARPALRRPELGRREYQSHLRKASPLARVLGILPAMGRMIRIFEGSFGRLRLSDLDAHDDIARAGRSGHRAAQGDPELVLLNPGKSFRNAAARARWCSMIAGEWLHDPSRPRSTASSASPSRSSASRSRRASASSPIRSPSRC
jgi:hypothetical protein